MEKGKLFVPPFFFGFPKFFLLTYTLHHSVSLWNFSVKLMGGKSSKHKRRKHQNVTGFRRIPDKFDSLEQVQAALREAGLESSNRTLIILIFQLFCQIRKFVTNLSESLRNMNVKNNYFLLYLLMVFIIQ
jgi:hypothetical protein